MEIKLLFVLVKVDFALLGEHGVSKNLVFDFETPPQSPYSLLAKIHRQL